MASIAPRRTSTGWDEAKGPAILVIHYLMEPGAKRPDPEAIFIVRQRVAEFDKYLG
jgi:hypothetical protein